MAKIKATIITGFLGAGKTTFINNLLSKNKESKFALVENEFGKIAIDTKLVKGVDAGRMFELKNGCICCTITNEYELILLELAERFPDVEHLIIETTGIADPISVIRPFFADDEIKDKYNFNGTVCLVDSVNFENQPDKEISQKQIAAADLVFINKTDLVNESEINILREKITLLNPLAEILLSEHGFSENFKLDSLTNIYKNKFLPYSAKHNHSHLSTKTLIFTEPVDKEKFTEWLLYTLDIYKKQIYRVKGILFFKNEPFEYILQGVGSGFDITEAGLAFDKESKIVFIGKLKEIDIEFI